MSSSNATSSTSPSDILNFEALELTARIDCGVAALLAFEYALTFGAERQHIWHQRKTLVFFLFVGLRYSNILFTLFECLSDFMPGSTDEGCAVVLYFWSAFNTINILCICGTFALRCYAIWGRNNYVLVGLVVLGLGCSATLGVEGPTDTIAANVDISRRVASCIGAGSPIGTELSSASKYLTIAFDTIVLLLTAAKTIQQVVRSRRIGQEPGLAYIILRDGVLYFGVIEALQVAAVVVDTLATPPWISSILGGFKLTLSSILTQRLILNLRQVDEKIRSGTVLSSNTGDMMFAHGSVIGNIGAPLRDEDDHDDEESTGPADSMQAY